MGGGEVDYTDGGRLTTRRGGGGRLTTIGGTKVDRQEEGLGLTARKGGSCATVRVHAYQH